MEEAGHEHDLEAPEASAATMKTNNNAHDRSNDADDPDSAPPSAGGEEEPPSGPAPNEPFRMQVRSSVAVRKRKLGQQTSERSAATQQQSSSSSSSGEDDDDIMFTSESLLRGESSSHASGFAELYSSQANAEQNPSPVKSPRGESPTSETIEIVEATKSLASGATPTSPASTAATTPGASSGGSEGSRGASPSVEQPEGWRVKLYRLNSEGSWDDCGTGRIVCLYRPSNASSSASSSSSSSSPSALSKSSKLPTPGSDAWLFHETGEATLCVHAEMNKQNKSSRVLLRTRILLRDAYQRQGDNIITWCEPYYGASGAMASGNNNNGGSPGSDGDGNGTGVDLALSFQENAGCLDVWRQITYVQARAADLLRHHQPQQLQHHGNSGSVEDMAAQIAAEHHADLMNRQQQEQNDIWGSGRSVSDDLYGRNNASGSDCNSSVNDAYANSVMEAIQSLPSPPTLQTLEEVADTIAALQHVQQREHLALFIAKEECAYLKSLLDLFPAAEEQFDYGKLATLAACVKTILLLNDPSILELIVSVAPMFEQVCSCLEYDPDLREKANHRWFLRERARFRTVVPMQDPELISAIHRSFRVQYLRDTLLRPTMDESSLSTLSSLQTFTHADVVKGVTMAEKDTEGSLYESYMIKVMEVLCSELHALVTTEWSELETTHLGASSTSSLPGVAVPLQTEDDAYRLRTDPSVVVVGNPSWEDSTTWKQYLAPQDSSLASRRVRRRGCLSFLKELFNMVRLSLQQNDKDDFFSIVCTIDIDPAREIADNVSQTSQTVEVGSVASTVRSDRLDAEGVHQPLDGPNSPPPTNLPSMLGAVLADPTVDVSEKGIVLDIIAGIVMHDPDLVRRHSVSFHASYRKLMEAKSGRAVSTRPVPNEKKQVILLHPASDVLASLLSLFSVATDAGILLQVSEILRIILDTDMLSDNGPIADEAEGVPPGVSGHLLSHEQQRSHLLEVRKSKDQKEFLNVFYEHYVEWLVAPFQFTMLYPVRRVPDHLLLDTSESELLHGMVASHQKGGPPDENLLKTVTPCAIRSSFAVELMSFCVRAHQFRMRFFLLKSSVMANVLKLLRPSQGRGISGDRCLKLAALRFLRATLSVSDEMYHRHVIQNDLFAPVFEALRSNPVGDNLVSSAIVEMCDFIHTENIKSLIEYIVTKYLSPGPTENGGGTSPLEDIASPYVSTLTVLRKAYESNLMNRDPGTMGEESSGTPTSSSAGGGGVGSRYFDGGSAHHLQPLQLHPHPASGRRHLSGRALEDQRKFREADQDESYFDSSDDDDENENDARSTASHGSAGSGSPSSVPAAIDEVDVQQQQQQHRHAPPPRGEGGGGNDVLHRTPRMFSLAQAPLLSNLEGLGDTSGAGMDGEERESGSQS